MKPRNDNLEICLNQKEVLEGLQKPQKELPSKMLYDEEGSRLFDHITTLEEYYHARTEMAIMQASIGEIVSLIGDGAMLVEYGSGSSDKTRILLEHLPKLAAYVPIDISKEHLFRSAEAISKTFRDLDVYPLWADYNQPFELPTPANPVARTVAYYPGSTIGNFHPKEAVVFLEGIARQVGTGGALLLGVDLKKDPKLLHAAYNDRDGVTAAFNQNLLRRLNRELYTDFQIDQFSHRAIYNKAKNRVEMHLVSNKDQIVRVGEADIPFKEGEYIWTESSYKYTLENFEHLAIKAGFTVHNVWTDKNNFFSLQYLTASRSGRGFHAS